MRKNIYIAPTTEMVGLATSQLLETVIPLNGSVEKAEPGDDLNANTTEWDTLDDGATHQRAHNLWEED